MEMKKFLAVTSALIVLGTGNVYAKAVEEPVVEKYPERVVQEPFQEKQTQYLLRGGDELVVRVHGYPELSSPDHGDSTPYVIRPDGCFHMPIIGEVNALNRTVSDVCHEIEERYRKYLKNPVVDINVIKLGTIRVYVLGKVQKQGLYEFQKSHNLLDALSAAGGFTDKSSKKNVFVIRAGEEEPCLKLDLRKFLKGEVTGLNVTLNEGDCVYITSNHKISFSKDIHPIISGLYYLDHIN